MQDADASLTPCYNTNKAMMIHDDRDRDSFIHYSNSVVQSGFFQKAVPTPIAMLNAGGLFWFWYNKIFWPYWQFDHGISL
jgi:hypothetical protein